MGKDVFPRGKQPLNLWITFGNELENQPTAQLGQKVGYPVQMSTGFPFMNWML